MRFHVKDKRHPRNIERKDYVEQLVHMNTLTRTIRDFDAERPDLKVYTVCKDMDFYQTYEWCIERGATHKTLEDCIAMAERVLVEIGTSDPARSHAIERGSIPWLQELIERRDKHGIERG
jgi:hypothetical protein